MTILLNADISFFENSGKNVRAVRDAREIIELLERCDQCIERFEEAFPEIKLRKDSIHEIKSSLQECLREDN